MKDTHISDLLYFRRGFFEGRRVDFLKFFSPFQTRAQGRLQDLQA